LAGIPVYSLQCLQSVLNAVARLVTDCCVRHTEAHRSPAYSGFRRPIKLSSTWRSADSMLSDHFGLLCHWHSFPSIPIFCFHKSLDCSPNTTHYHLELGFSSRRCQTLEHTSYRCQPQSLTLFVASSNLFDFVTHTATFPDLKLLGISTIWGGEKFEEVNVQFLAELTEVIKTTDLFSSHKVENIGIDTRTPIWHPIKENVFIIYLTTSINYIKSITQRKQLVSWKFVMDS